MSKHNKQYSVSFKREAVELMESSGKAHAQLARELGVSDSALYRWRREYGDGLTLTDKGMGRSLAELEAENKRLQREVVVLRQEREVLKKAISIFSQERP